jgi:hypothetical protein
VSSFAKNMNGSKWALVAVYCAAQDDSRPSFLAELVRIL